MQHSLLLQLDPQVDGARFSEGDCIPTQCFEHQAPEILMCVDSQRDLRRDVDMEPDAILFKDIAHRLLNCLNQSERSWIDRR